MEKEREKQKQLLFNFDQIMGAWTVMRVACRPQYLHKLLTGHQNTWLQISFCLSTAKQTNIYYGMHCRFVVSPELVLGRPQQQLEDASVAVCGAVNPRANVMQPSFPAPEHGSQQRRPTRDVGIIPKVWRLIVRSSHARPSLHLASSRNGFVWIVAIHTRCQNGNSIFVRKSKLFAGHGLKTSNQGVIRRISAVNHCDVKWNCKLEPIHS